MGNASDNQKRIQRLIQRDGQRCRYCGRPVIPSISGYVDNGWSIDHMTAKSNGGSNHIDNLVLACRKCNGRKAKKSYHEFKMAIETDGIIKFLMGVNDND